MPRLKHRFTNLEGTIRVKGTDSGGPYKSTLERDAFIWWHFQRGVSRIQLAPCPVVVQGLRKEKPYHPDLAVKFFDASCRQPILIETKYSDHLTRHSETRDHFDRVNESVRKQGFEFLVQTEKDIRTAAFPSMRFVFGFVGNVPSQYDHSIQELFVERSTIGIGEICSTLTGNPWNQLEVAGAVWRLVAVRILAVDFNKPLNREACVSLNTGARVRSVGTA